MTPELRVSQIEALDDLEPALLCYFAENYDMRGRPIPVGVRRVTVRSLVRLFLTSPATVLEAPEPLWMRFLLRWVVIVVAWRWTGMLRGIRRCTVVYAMENNDIATLIGGGRPVPRPFRWLFVTVTGALVRRYVDRLCFATSGAAETYRTLGVGGLASTTILELQAPAQPSAAPGSPTAAFVGSLSARKGVPDLLRAWPDVERLVPGAQLVIAGAGPLEAEVASWVAERPWSRSLRGLLDPDGVRELFDEASVNVSLAVPEGRWREQVGLPILEGLSSGCTVVATDQTGIADWLEDNGHHVVAPHDDAAIATSLVAALRAPLDRDAVRSSLPSVDGAVRSNRWLHRRSPAAPQAARSVR